MAELGETAQTIGRQDWSRPASMLMVMMGKGCWQAGLMEWLPSWKKLKGTGAICRLMWLASSAIPSMSFKAICKRCWTGIYEMNDEKIARIFDQNRIYNG